MDVFDLDRNLVDDYARFARSFTQIRASDIATQVEAIYATHRFWPEPLISLNPNFERDVDIAALAAEGSLHPHTAAVFRDRGTPLTLYRHQAQAVAKASARQSFVVTTGTGSGKSLCFFVPIIDAAIRARVAGEAPRTRAIVIYPMNALANSQIEELRKFVDQSGLPEKLRPTFERYTGQEESVDRDRIRELRPDILLTNFMMLELLMTRQNNLDQAVISNAQDLDFIVLDELHTYRGRQGADVAMLVRRLRDRLCQDHAPICIGTSATMISDDASSDAAAAVATVASRLFGAQITSDGVIGESLERATDPSIALKSLGAWSVLRALPEDSPEQIAEKRRRFETARTDRLSYAWGEAADLYIAAFLLPKHGEPPPLGAAPMVPTSGDVWRALADKQVHPPLVARAVEASRTARAFHWLLEFPDVMAAGGFDVVLETRRGSGSSCRSRSFSLPSTPKLPRRPTPRRAGG